MKHKLPVLLLPFALAAVPAAAADCESLTSLKLEHASVTSAQSVAAGALPAPAAKGKATANPFADLPAFCRVMITSKPSADSDIKIEVWLPAQNWNGNFQANGNGGWTGSISANTLADGLKRGYAAAMTDTGHEGGSASFAMGHPEKIIDFGYRSIHEMAVTGKAAAKAFYGRDVRKSYWDGCSAGGRQALKAAQMFPQDFDGIVAGSPGLMWTGRSTQAVWIGQATHKSDAAAIPPEKFQAIHNAALAACDAIDGVKDGVMEDPRKCKFDPGTLACKGADANDCLTPAQVATARVIYSDVKNPRTGRIYFPGHEPGSELGWRTMASANPFGPGTDFFKYVVFQDEKWDYKTLNFDADIEKAMALGKDMDALDTNLKPFFDRGGKLIQYHGWSDPQISPRSSVMYYEDVTKKLGAAAVQKNYRLFMVPGMAHCGGGEGTSTFDMVAAIEDWVERGKAPDRIEASRTTAGKVDRTRPLCPYPQTAKYKGSGNTDESASFSCAVQ